VRLRLVILQLDAPGGLDSALQEQVTNDVPAFIQAIAQQRGRNAQWAEQAVGESVSMSEQQASASQVAVTFILTSLLLLPLRPGYGQHATSFGEPVLPK
jgi:membrane-bound ClpP family serine protease